VITPNIPEAEKMTNMKITSQFDMKEAARTILKMGCRAVLVKGGHATGDATDILYDGKAFYTYPADRVDTKNTHGTGCTFSSAIASNLALGLPLSKSAEHAKAYITTAIAHSLSIGKGNGPTNHFYDLYKAGGLNTNE
jgi:hydroxymethylpyrimidine/phosphomethylpyrimidine kinase